MDTIAFGKGAVRAQLDAKSLAFQVTAQGRSYASDEENPAWFALQDGKKFYFADGVKIEHTPFSSGLGEGVRTRYTDFKGEDGAIYAVSFETRIWVEEETGYLQFEWLPPEEGGEEIAQVAWPAPLRFGPHPGGYSVLPIMQGMLIPDESEDDAAPTMSRRMFGRESYMPWWGQAAGYGYMAIVETPWDAEYDFRHAPKEQTTVRIRWISSLGTMAYRRQLTLRFYDACDYVLFCKEFRKYSRMAGNFVSLEEKIARNPKVAELIGAPVVNTGCIHWYCEPESVYYNKEDPAANDVVYTFDEFAEKIRRIKAAGVDKAYIHIDGWGFNGYDNLHPDILPPSPKAGGTEGLRRMLDTIRELGYTSALHDQYRDYYFKAATFNEDQAVRLPDGRMDTCAIWPGGEQAMLCAALAPRYVDRNYRRLEKEGIHPDGAYLDVFSVVELDECDHPDHRMTRKECMEYRSRCFETIRERGMIVSSEEPIDRFAAHLDLVHHGPYAYAVWEACKATPYGIPVPLFNLVYHDSLLIPWCPGRGIWGLPKTDEGMLHALLNGGMPMLGIEPSAQDVERAGIIGRLHKAVAKEEMVSHRFIDGNPRQQETVFSDGTCVQVDLDKDTYQIRFADGTELSGKA